MIGFPGDRIELSRGRLLINGTPFRYQGQVIDFAPPLLYDLNPVLMDDEPFTVPAGMVFVLGDNPSNSMDSRFSSYGFIPLNSLVGKITTLVWPLYRIRRL
jgi:signal peptidase I